MYDFSSDPNQPKAELYSDLLSAAKALTEGEPDTIANMANIAALMYQIVPNLNWAGFYRMVQDELVLGPFCGKPACIRIPVGRGVCGAAVGTGQSQLVPDVHAFPGHIACDAESRAELVVPIMRDGKVIAVIDLDSPLPNRFDQEDQKGIEALAEILSARV
ncbi:GAF domain-containing protein [Altererythrobacter indicus]|uniref:GAF domain-containing protein n=1 Tax=Altericroceibacterium indicum TaxID=374177 RepID=A0A845ABW2_9SPHN|nr:GAF domain-containing protein [Altericroceibacterium indicum]MXP26481.1 GAF domain-containing protein [Altericroceibacterium indicum]